jgi:predicted lipoprotein with Yx(FWY)xxD motif
VTLAYACLIRGTGRTIALYGRNAEKVRAEVADLAHGLQFVPMATVTGPGLPGRVGTITRTDGSRQLTYNGHPLYTDIGDSAPGQARGNNLNLNGAGLWREVRV